jgi:hypothetical protein
MDNFSELLKCPCEPVKDQNLIFQIYLQANDLSGFFSDDDDVDYHNDDKHRHNG